jgi:RND family efflux transporter MFP subunit
MVPKVFNIVKRPFKWFKKTRRRNKIFVIIGLIILILIVIGQISAANAPSPYTVEKAKKATITQYVSETGNVNTAGRVDVYSPATGIVEEVYVENGQAVEKDQALFYVRSTATEQERATAYANYQTAVSNQKTAEQGKLGTDAQMWQAQQVLLDAKNAQNYKNSHTQNPATGSDYTQLEKESIDAAVVQAEKNFRALEKKLSESDSTTNATSAHVNAALFAYQSTDNVVVKAPASGTIANFAVKVGNTVSASMGTSGSAASAITSTATPALTIANFDSYSIRITLNEVDIPKVSTGQKAEVSLDAFTGKKFRGSVSHVDSVGTNTQGVITYTVLVDILNPDAQIKPGMTASVDIEVDKEENVLSVPNSAVKPYKGGRAVRVVDEKTKEMKYITVQVGIKGDDRSQIVKGISEGQEVITALSNDQVKQQSMF